jgi:cell division protein FtsL
MPEEEKKECFNWTKGRAIAATLVSVFALIGMWYTVDCLNIKYFGDTLYAKDTEFAQFKKIRKLERKIDKKEDRLEHLKSRKKDDLLWLSRVKDQYPDLSLMPPKLKKEYEDTAAQQLKLTTKINKIESKLEKWREELDDLELELESNGKGG